MNKKKWFIIGGAGLVVLVVAVILIIMNVGGGGGSSADRVFVENVGSLVSANTGAVNRFTGVVEPERILDIERGQDNQVAEILVAVGDTVSVGTPLFVYDTEKVQTQMALDQLSLEELDNQILDLQNQIRQLERERGQAPENQRFQYTSQILTAQTSIKQAEFNIQSKTIEIERQQTIIDNSTVYSEMDGIVRSISETGVDPSTGQTIPFMSILALGDVRIRGTANEMTIWDLSPEQAVIIRSRVNPEAIWTGTISEIDTNPEDNTSNDIWGGPSVNSASNYSFFVSLDSSQDLLLGQHVFIEPDFGQSGPRDGIWLFAGYIDWEIDAATGEQSNPFVWVANNRNRIEKRSITVGAFDERLGEYEILSGLTLEDYIAFPMPGLVEGITTVTNQDEVDFSSPLYDQGGDVFIDENAGNGFVDNTTTVDEVVDGQFDETLTGEEVVDVPERSRDTGEAVTP